MGRIYTVNGKPIDIDDTTAVQALSNEEFTELFTLVKDTAPVDGEHAIPPVRVDREPGEGFIITPRPTVLPAEEAPEEQS
ncbi:hypothetical protein [Microbacterium aurantiacum]|uniref:hypothetical protein n=1 Tax=Microbacterium aurantiacum TaxID=162393 RepID=UPI000C807BB4|nr:hypothetical protein [Microbacterium aurantiacum]